MVAVTTRPKNEELRERWQALMAGNPGLRIRQAADQLGVSEMELVQLRPTDSQVALKNDFPGLMQDMKTVGPVMILARNDQVVHEVTAAFGDFTVGSTRTMGLAVGDVDVRVFFSQWAYGFHVREEVRSGQRESLQFFDRYGRAIQKVYRVDETDGDAWAALLEKYRAPVTEPVAITGKRPPLQRTRPEDVDVPALQKDWAALKDVHHFNAMLKRHGVDRLTALELVGPDWVDRLSSGDGRDTSPLDLLLENARKSQCPLMFFVGNPGIVQIYTGIANNLCRTGPWMNVLDENFSLHADTSGITDWFIVRKPTVDGTVTAVEAFNSAGEIVLTVFGERKPGKPELAQWRAEVEALREALCDG